MGSDDLIYLLRRASEERIRTAQAECAHARNAHNAMADAYEHRARAAMITLPDSDAEHGMANHLRA